MSTKRVILANSSRLLREMLHRVINQAENLEVVQQISILEELAPAIQRFDPEWVILTSPYRAPAPTWINAWLLQYPSVRFIVLAPDYSSFRTISRHSPEEDLAHLSLSDFIHVLERDLQHT